MRSILLILLFSLSAYANNQTYVLKSSEVSYKVDFPLKTVYGKSSDSKGKGVCDKKSCDFLIAVPVKSFKSGDTNRDVHMQEVTKESQYPLLTVNSTFSDPDNITEIDLEIDFAGVKKTIKKLKLSKNKTDRVIEINSTFPILLSEFKINRPSLLGVSIDDKVEIDVKTKWELAP